MPDGRAERRHRMWFGNVDRHASMRALIEHGGYTGTEIVAHLHNKIAFARRARGRAGAPLGRFQNWLGDDDPNYVSLPGSLLAALFRAQDQDDVLDIAPSEEAKLRLDIAEDLLKATETVMREMERA